jgi:predicted nucleic acid-binding protein
LDRLPPSLHAGEREAIALAKERKAQLLVDETRARQTASEIGFEIIGTLRILAEAKRLGLVDAVRAIIAEMQSSGYRFDRALIRQLLERVGEV